MLSHYLKGSALEALTFENNELPLFIKICELNAGDRDVILSLICRLVCRCEQLID